MIYQASHTCYLGNMPQTRTLLHRTDTLMVERVVSHAAPIQWSPSYQAVTPRMALPASGSATEFRMAGQTVLLDGLTLLCLPVELPYQMRPCTVAVRASIVVSVQPQAERKPGPHALWVPGPPSLLQPDAYILAPRAIVALRRHWRMLAQRPAAFQRGQATQALLRSVLKSAHRPPFQPGGPVAAVQRAQRFMVARVAAADGLPWTLHDVADAACCSVFHLSRQFRGHMGIGLHGYRQRLRLAAALQRLEDGERNLAALAHELGYSSQSHLGEALRRNLGLTPAQLRRELSC